MFALCGMQETWEQCQGFVSELCSEDWGAGTAIENVDFKGRSWCSVRSKTKPQPSLCIKHGCYRAWKRAGWMLRQGDNGGS